MATASARSNPHGIRPRILGDKDSLVVNFHGTGTVGIPMDVVQSGYARWLYHTPWMEFDLANLPSFIQKTVSCISYYPLVGSIRGSKAGFRIGDIIESLGIEVERCKGIASRSSNPISLYEHGGCPAFRLDKVELPALSAFECLLKEPEELSWPGLESHVVHALENLCGLAAPLTITMSSVQDLQSELASIIISDLDAGDSEDTQAVLQLFPKLEDRDLRAVGQSRVNIHGYMNRFIGCGAETIEAMRMTNVLLGGSRAADFFIQGSSSKGSDWDFYCVGGEVHLAAFTGWLVHKGLEIETIQA